MSTIRKSIKARAILCLLKTGPFIIRVYLSAKTPNDKVNVGSFQITHRIPECTREYYSKSAGNGYGPSQAFLANDLWKKGDYYESARWYAKAADNKVDEVCILYIYTIQFSITPDKLAWDFRDS